MSESTRTSICRVFNGNSPCLLSQDEGGKRPKRRYAGGENGGGLSQRKRGNCAVACGGKEIETDVRRVLHERQRVRELRTSETQQEREARLQQVRHRVKERRAI